MAAKRNVVQRTLRTTRNAFSKYVPSAKSAEDTLDYLLEVIGEARQSLAGYAGGASSRGGRKKKKASVKRAVGAKRKGVSTRKSGGRKKTKKKSRSSR